LFLIQRSGQSPVQLYACIAFAAGYDRRLVTSHPRGTPRYFTKLDELVLIAVLVAHLRSPSDMPAPSGGQTPPGPM
jgi:hypothetical protein